MDVIWPCIIRAGLAEPEIFFTKNYVMVGTPRRNPTSEPHVGTPRRNPSLEPHVGTPRRNPVLEPLVGTPRRNPASEPHA